LIRFMEQFDPLKNRCRPALFHLLRWDSPVKAILDTLSLRRKEAALRIKFLRDMNTSDEEEMMYRKISVPFTRQTYEDLLEHRHFTIYKSEDLKAYHLASGHVHAGLLACLRQIAILKKEEAAQAKEEALKVKASIEKQAA
jgi:hypothetical protein